MPCSIETARELLQQQVRSAREVIAPNLCRIFALVVEELGELVSMEYIDILRSLAFHPDGKWLATSWRYDGLRLGGA